VRFRTKHIADSVVERIQAVANNTTASVANKGASTIHMARTAGGDLVVTKNFERGEPELMTISGQEPEQQSSRAGFVEIDLNKQPSLDTGNQAQGVAPEQGGVVENAALGGNSIDELLRG